MTPEEQKGIAEFIRKYVVLVADLSALTAMLDAHAERKKHVPQNWRDEWNEMQKGEDYQVVLQLYDPLLSAIRQARSDAALIALLHQASKAPKTPSRISRIPPTSLSRSRAAPGNPSGNIENRRCRVVNPLSRGGTAAPKNKLGANDRAHAVNIALKRGIISLEE
jgi:hypothetical protein